MTRTEVLNEIIDRHIDCLDAVENPGLQDTKILTEILKAILVLEQIKALEGKKTEYDNMSVDELEKKLESFE